MRFISSVPSGLNHYIMSYGIIDDGRHATQGLGWAAEHTASLGQDLADIPVELGLDPAVEFRVVVEGQRRTFKASVRQEIYQIAREAIVNACRHSRAENIEIELTYLSAQLCVSVRDDGCGINVQGIRGEGPGRRGLWAMRERAEKLGATLRILSGVGRGTEIELHVPGRVAFAQS